MISNIALGSLEVPEIADVVTRESYGKVLLATNEKTMKIKNHVIQVGPNFLDK